MPFYVRQSLSSDLEAVLRVAKHLDSYNLPYDRSSIKKILTQSEQSFRGELPPEERAFTFVAVDTEGGELVGTSMLYAKHGTHQFPHVYLDVLQDEHYSESLGKYMVHQALRIGFNYDGPSEIGGLILLPEYRGHKQSLGKLLSYCRFLYIAMNRSIFRDEVISELLPRLEKDGTSRLWKHFGKRFTGLTYREADRMSKDNKEFIRSLFPSGLVYTSLFPEKVRDEIGVVGPTTVGVERMLKSIGFRFSNQIDPFDGGPHFSAKTDSIRLIAEAAEYTQESTPSAESEKKRTHIVCSNQPEEGEFRCCWSSFEDTKKLTVAPTIKKILRIKTGQHFWAAPL